MSKSKKTTKTTLKTVRLNERDIEVFEALASHRLLSTAQIACLFTPTYDAARRLMRRLRKAELVIRIFQPVGGTKSAKESVWALARKGAAEVARSRECPLPSHLTARDRHSNLFIDHTLARNDFRICFELLHRSKKLELLRWEQAKDEVKCVGELRGPFGIGERVSLIADGYLVVRYKGKAYHLLLESDMGTTALKRMDAKFKGYWRWWKYKGPKKSFGASNVRVLTVTSSYARLGNLRQLAMHAPDQTRRGSGLFWFTTLGHIDPHVPEDVLEKIWWSAHVGKDEPIHLFNK